MINMHSVPSTAHKAPPRWSMPAPKTPKKKRKARKTDETVTINKKWFVDKLADSRVSQRQLAGRLHLDPASMNRTFRGARKMQLDEAAAIAKIVGATIDEVLTNAGIDVREVSSKKGRVPVKGWIDGDFNVHTTGLRGERFVAQLPHEAPGLEALRLQTANTPADALDGNIVYYRPSTTVSSGAIGRWCVVKLMDGSVRLRVLKPGYRRGTYNLLHPIGGQAEEDVVLASAAPVVRVEF